MNGTEHNAFARGWRARLRGRPQLRSELVLIAGAPLLWMALYNARFWHDVSEVMWRHSLSGTLFLVALFCFALFAQSLLLIWLPQRLLRPVLSLLFLVAAPVAYFTQQFGTLMDTDMMRNVFATDRAEATGLLNGELILYVLLLGVVPCVLLWWPRWAALSLRRRWQQRAMFFGATFAVAVIALVSMSASFASFFREHKPLRYLLNPAAPVYSAIHYAVGEGRTRKPRIVETIGAPLSRVAHAGTGRHQLFFLVIGETARRANFQLQGYARATNPELSAIPDLIYFNDVTSCGTATAVSLPCLFSHLARRDFDAETAGNTTNLLDILLAAGVHVEWLDANSGCKGICARVPHTQFSGNQSSDPLCQGPYCFDEVMLRDLDARLAKIDRDAVIVFHQAGSHGPAYAQRYPKRFEVFKPACHSNQLDECTPAEVINAYDDSIVYTDHNLAEQIRYLQRVADRWDGALLYVSDHGESLGENGVYLHGMPFTFAPKEQKEVPMVMWLSNAFGASSGFEPACVRARAHEPFSHDNVFHTVLGAMGVRTPLYQDALDITARCRGKA